jgi:hypothetical protein
MFVIVIDPIRLLGFQTSIVPVLCYRKEAVLPRLPDISLFYFTPEGKRNRQMYSQEWLCY